MHFQYVKCVLFFNKKYMQPYFVNCFASKPETNWTSLAENHIPFGFFFVEFSTSYKSFPARACELIFCGEFNSHSI